MIPACENDKLAVSLSKDIRTSGVSPTGPGATHVDLTPLPMSWEDRSLIRVTRGPCVQMFR